MHLDPNIAQSSAGSKFEVEDANIQDWAQYSEFEENTIGEVDGAVENNDGADDLGQMLQDVKEDCGSKKDLHDVVVFLSRIEESI